MKKRIFMQDFTEINVKAVPKYHCKGHPKMSDILTQENVRAGYIEILEGNISTLPEKGENPVEWTDKVRFYPIDLAISNLIFFAGIREAVSHSPYLKTFMFTKKPEKETHNIIYLEQQGLIKIDHRYAIQEFETLPEVDDYFYKRYFNERKVRNLCSRFGIDYDTYFWGGDNKNDELLRQEWIRKYRITRDKLRYN